jgi:uncharacterized membrane protein YuzA (DUF378 family)
MIKMREFGFMRWMDILALALLLVGGLFLGFGGIFGFEIMTAAIGQLGLFGRIVYVLIGLSALYELFELRAIPRRWHCTLLTRTTESPTS